MSQASAIAMPAPAAGSGQRGNGWLPNRDQRACQRPLLGPQIGDAIFQRHFRPGYAAAHALDVAARAEGVAGPGDQDRSDVGVIAALLDRPPQRGRQLIRKRIPRLRPVQCDRRDPVVDFAKQFVRTRVDG
jgi:hypothetical protein